MEKLI